MIWTLLLLLTLHLLLLAMVIHNATAWINKLPPKQLLQLAYERGLITEKEHLSLIGEEK